MTASGDPGPLLASGRAADVYDIGDGKVLRRYRQPNVSTHYERRVMRFMASEAVRVPQVFDLDSISASIETFDDRDIVMERIDGPTLFDDLAQRPWKIVAYAHLLARLQRQINAVTAPDWMFTPSAAATAKRRDDSVLHLDLHPMNIIMAVGGPVIIDWTNASGGPAGFDAALTYVEVAGFEVNGARDQIGQRIFMHAFRRRRGSGEIDAFIVAACDHRLADRGTLPSERIAVAAIRKRAIEQAKARR